MGPWVHLNAERAMRKCMHWAMGGVCLVGFNLSCSSQPLDESEDRAGSLRAAIEIGPSTHDVTAVRFDLVPPDGGCDAPALSTLAVPVAPRVTC